MFRHLDRLSYREAVRDGTIGSVSDHPICVTCGVQFPRGHDTARCPVCDEERQYVGYGGQQWTTLEALRGDHANVLRQEPRGVWGVSTEPWFGIGQRALIVPGEDTDGTPANLLWDCISLVDDDTVRRIGELGGLAAIAISHPHYYSAMLEWSDAFGGIPVYVHADDAHWVEHCVRGRTDPVRLWEGDTLEVLPGRTLLNLRVHFAGGTVVHWQGADGRGAVCSGDILQVVSDRRWVSFMYSYPNLIPEHPDTVRRAVRMLEPYDFDVVYGAWWGKVLDGSQVEGRAKAAVRRSAERYLRHLGEDL
ncbi:hypothetical protein GCM10023353_12830 [Tomitella cavernea]|uniref:MBL fold metallo-hydrolase n=1 Tax=Tomitella cavernea TaxID=1387982 RepID=A0ABP9CGK7_9ACTN